MGKRGQRYKREANKQINYVNLDQSEPWGFAVTLGTEIRKRCSVPCLRIIIHAFTMASGALWWAPQWASGLFLWRPQNRLMALGWCHLLWPMLCACVTTFLYGVSICVSVCVCVRYEHIYVLECVWCACVYWMCVIHECARVCAWVWVNVGMHMYVHDYECISECKYVCSCMRTV